MSQYKIANSFEPPLPHTTVQSIIKKYNATGTVENQPRSGRQEILNNQDKEKIQNKVLKNSQSRSLTLKKIIESLNLNVYDKVICKAMKDMGINSYHAIFKPYVNPVNIAKRVTWCNEHLN
ncbi:4235_t:CDS:1, partial [Acaulospora morrowiae]